MDMRTTLVAIAVATLLLGCGPDVVDTSSLVYSLVECEAAGPASVTVTDNCWRDDSPWPFTVDEVVLACEDDAITATSGGTTYALNGLAQTLLGAQDLDPIWADNPDIDGAKISITDMSDAARDLC